jgi:DNA polymerase III subunit alpha
MAIKILKEVTTKNLEDFIYTIDLKDPNLYKELANPYKIGLFQINGGTAEKLCNEVKPENFDELIAINAMARPGPMETAAPYFVERKHGSPSPYPQAVNDILKDTHSTFVYQEQIMEIFHKIGGFSLEEANEVRGLMKKLGKLEKNPEDVKKWDKIVKKFVHGATKNGIQENTAQSIANDLAAFSGYSFNKSHATSYSYIAAITVYLSYYFRPWFYSSVLTYEVDREKYLLERLYSVKNQGVEILPPDINKSQNHFYPEDSTHIRFGLSDIKYVSETASEIIMQNRPYKDLFDYIIKTRSRNVTSRVTAALISVGAFDSFSTERKKLLTVFNSFWENKGSIKIEEKLRAIYEKAEIALGYIPGLGTAEADLVAYEKEFIGFRFFSSPFTKEKIQAFKELRQKFLIYYTLTEVGRASKKIPICLNKIKTHKDKNGNMMAFLDIEDIKGNQMSVPIFSSYYKYLSGDLIENGLYLMNLFMGNDGKLLFGRDEWMDKEFDIKRLIKKI